MSTGRPPLYESHIVARREQALYGISEYVFKAWKAHFDNSLHRGIAFRFSLFEWDQWWKRELRNLGPAARRGRRKGEYMMARFHDQGAYEHNNVYVATAGQNSNDIPADIRSLMVRKANATLRRAGRLRGAHLRLGNKHPRAVEVRTPLGVFASLRLASLAHGISANTGQRRFKRGEWTKA